MISRLFRAKNRGPQFTIRTGLQTDIEFVVRQVVADSKDGHFARGIPTKILIDNQIKMLKASIHGQPIQMQTDSGLSHRNSSLFIIFESGQYNSIGFALVLCDVESKEKFSEILVASIRPEMRGKGYGKIFMKMLVGDLINQTSLKARCYEKSKVMMKILLSLNFKIETTTDTGTIHFYRARKN